MLFKYPLFLPDSNQDCCSNNMCYYPAYERDCNLDIIYFYLVKVMTAIQISSLSTRHNSGLLFRYPLFLPSLRPRLRFKYYWFLLGKNQDCYLDILYFYQTQYETAIQISFIYTSQKSGLLFKYPLFLPGLRPRLLFKFSLFLLGKN